MSLMTEPAIALHTAARRYCQEKHEYWWRTYTQTNWSQADGYGIFPRYLLYHAILNEVERISAPDISDLNAMRERVLQAGMCADDGMTLNLKVKLRDEKAIQAMDEERMSFLGYVRSLTTANLSDVAGLPQRFVFPKKEAESLWAGMAARWNVTEASWYPIAGNAVIDGVLAFHTDLFRTQRNGFSLLRECLTARRINPVCRFEAFDTDPPSNPASEIDVALVGETESLFCELYWFSRETDWLVYASHESSITIAGQWLVAAFKDAWPDWKGLQYGGPFSTPNLCGTWEWESK